ncbi:MAG: peptidoglycan DD-metalloendopeptidase family protein [Fibrobacter sp.]|nr:peptidoglycan DD-metalloendopeptidase family protein [Fibrobacter sp.]
MKISIFHADMKFVNAFILSIAMLPAISAANDVLAMASTDETEIVKGSAIADSTLNEASVATTSEESVATAAEENSANAENADEANAEETVASAESEDSEELDSLQESTLDETAAAFLDFSGAHFPTIHGTRMNSPYGIRKHRLHRGVDMHISIGDSIVAAYPGKVVVSKYNRRGYGHYVMIEHENGTRTLYGHLKKRLVNVGDVVEGGQLVGWGGNTGRSSGPHLHFEIRYGEVNIDPATVFNIEEGSLLENANHFSIASAVESHNEIQKELSKHRYHRIRPGDTLGKIAIKYGTTIEKLCRLNGIKRTSILRIGQTLRCS